MSIDKGIAEYNVSDLTTEKLNHLITQKESFKVTRMKEMSTVIRQVEHVIEDNGLTCRVYTEYRSAAMAGSLIPIGITQAIGIASAIGIGLHNLATYDPDYEIGKNEITNSITVIYKKS